MKTNRILFLATLLVILASCSEKMDPAPEVPEISGLTEKVRFEQVFMFIYSRRVGTRADKMENQVPEEIKHKRFNRLKELVEGQVEENNKKYINTIQKVLVEGKSKNNDFKYKTGGLCK